MNTTTVPLIESALTTEHVGAPDWVTTPIFVGRNVRRHLHECSLHEIKRRGKLSTEDWLAQRPEGGDTRQLPTRLEEAIWWIGKCIEFYSDLSLGRVKVGTSFRSWTIPRTRGDRQANGKKFKRWAPTHEEVVQRLDVAQESLIQLLRCKHSLFKNGTYLYATGVDNCNVKILSQKINM